MIATLSRSTRILLVLAPLALLSTATLADLQIFYSDFSQTEYLLHRNNPRCNEAESRRMQAVEVETTGCR